MQVQRGPTRRSQSPGRGGALARGHIREAAERRESKDVASLETMASADLRLPALLARLLLGFPKPLDERRGRLTNIVLLARGVRVPLDDFIFLEEVDVVPAGVG